MLAAPSQSRAKEPWLLDLEGTLGTPLAKPQSRWYGVGGSLALSVQRPLVSWLALTLRLRTAGFLDGESPEQSGVKNPSFGTLNMAGAGLVLRVPSGDVRRATGLWFDAIGGGGFTGDKFRAAFDLGVGYGFSVSDTVSLSPVVRYVQVVQRDNGLSGNDAMLGLIGLRVSLFDNKPGAQRAPAAKEPVVDDRDGDGILDGVDQCVDVPEDKDGFEDTDGCPEVDNDNDGILDVNDGCPNIAEDRDGFQDDDGCLDDDNDRDGFLDKEDQCPREPETINGVDDQDGCPDEGLIVMEDDRIVLEERVLFETDRARLTRGSEPVLRAIIQLWKQHPEWTKVRIEGHADRRGDAAFNQELSERRAANVRDALIRLGMNKEMVVAEGYGATQLLRQGETDADHQANRRVEFVVISREERAMPLPMPGSSGAAGAQSGDTQPMPNKPNPPAPSSTSPQPSPGEPQP